MRYFALIENNIVINVVVCNDPVLLSQGNWIETFRSGVQKKIAGIGYTYNSTIFSFIPPKPYDSWILDEKTCKWNAPIEKPEGNYCWNESEQKWEIYDFTNNT